MCGSVGVGDLIVLVGDDLGGEGRLRDLEQDLFPGAGFRVRQRMCI